MPIQITEKDGVVGFPCPLCLCPTQLPPLEYNCEIKDGRMTVTKKHPAEKESPYRIDLKKQPGHTVNCDFTLFDAPVVTVGPPKAPTDSSQDSKKGRK